MANKMLIDAAHPEETRVVVLRGSAGLRIEGRAEMALTPGDHVFIPGGTRHWVARTDPDTPTLWLAVHLG